jgi:pimeloyl-ACP methyl ester carboxylesterase
MEKSIFIREAASETSPMVFYRSVMVDGLSIFYREAGRPDAPTLLLLHGFPSSSRMYEPLLTRLSAYFRQATSRRVKAPKRHQ